MNTEDFVTYEQALSLKKLGFDFEVNHYYSNEQLEELITGSTSDYDNCNSTDYIDSICSAPTLAQAQKWLRTKHKQSVEPGYDENWKCEIVNLTNSEWYTLDKSFSSYEEALSAGITECLKLLEE